MMTRISETVKHPGPRPDDARLLLVLQAVATLAAVLGLALQAVRP